MAARLSRKEIKHDQFVEDVNIAYSFAQGHRVPIVGIIVAVALVLGGIWGFWTWRASQETKAQGRLGEAITIIDAPTGATPGAQATDVVYKTEDEKIAKALPILNEVADKYSSSDAADVAQIYLARIAATRGDVATAKKKLEAFVSEHPDHLLAGGAQLSLYQLELASGDPKKVTAELEQKVNAPDKKVPTDALLSLLARAYEISGDHARARDVYQRIITEFPDSPYTLDAQRAAPPV